MVTPWCLIYRGCYHETVCLSFLTGVKKRNCGVDEEQEGEEWILVETINHIIFINVES